MSRRRRDPLGEFVQGLLAQYKNPCDEEKPLAPAVESDPLLGMSLDVFRSRSLILRVWSKVLDEGIYFVSGEAQVQALLEQGISRGKIYSAQELLALLELPGLSGEGVKLIHEAKQLFSGTATEVRVMPEEAPYEKAPPASHSSPTDPTSVTEKVLDRRQRCRNLRGRP